MYKSGHVDWCNHAESRFRFELSQLCTYNLAIYFPYLAPSTRLILGGDPSEYDPSLHNKHIKRTMLHDLKLKKHPDGLEILGEFYPARKFLTNSS
jgi:hypothetical protein